MQSYYSVAELRSRIDQLLPDWLDMYELSFPFEERLLISNFLRLLEEKERGEAQETTFSALVDAEGKLIGMAAYQIEPQISAGYLWYLAINPSVRGKGVGSDYYKEIIDKVFESAEVMLFEVEMPEHCQDEERRQNAKRRIAFYQRNGTALLSGIHYLQSVGSHVPPVPMHLMVCSRQSVTAQKAFEVARYLFGDAVRQIGPLALIGPTLSAT